MVLTHPFYCPTRVVEGHKYDEAVDSLLDGRSWLLVTSAGWRSRRAVERLISRCGSPVAIFDCIEENPIVSSIVDLASQVPDCEVVVALGGGSVIDAAKGIVTLHGLGLNADLLKQHLSEGVALPDSMSVIPIIAVPTTSGTGSEVTRWGTIWGDDGIKFSVTDPKLWPAYAVMDPLLCTSMPYSLTLATGLDALSHAMESVWNRRHTEATDAMSTAAIGLLWKHFEATLETPGDLNLRARIQTASLLAGLAMGTTQTALAHSISYPFTSRCGIPHGIACSFTLAEVARFNIETEPERLSAIADGLRCTVPDIPVVIEYWFDRLGLGDEILKYVTPDVTDGFSNNLITRARAANNIRDIDGAGAKNLARAALDRLCGENPLSSTRSVNN